jgi:hypothetical protein
MILIIEAALNLIKKYLWSISIIYIWAVFCFGFIFSESVFSENYPILKIDLKASNRDLAAKNALNYIKYNFSPKLLEKTSGSTRITFNANKSKIKKIVTYLKNLGTVYNKKLEKFESLENINTVLIDLKITGKTASSSYPYDKDFDHYIDLDIENGSLFLKKLKTILKTKNAEITYENYSKKNITLHVKEKKIKDESLLIVLVRKLGHVVIEKINFENLQSKSKYFKIIIKAIVVSPSKFVSLHMDLDVANREIFLKRVLGIIKLVGGKHLKTERPTAKKITIYGTISKEKIKDLSNRVSKLGKIFKNAINIKSGKSNLYKFFIEAIEKENIKPYKFPQNDYY